MKPVIRFTRDDQKWVRRSLVNQMKDLVAELDIPSLLPECNELEFRVFSPVKTGTPIHLAHGTWTKSGFIDAITPEGFTRQSDDLTVPRGTTKLVACCIDEWSGGMGTQFGFFGSYISMLIIRHENTVWDVRCCDAY